MANSVTYDSTSSTTSIVLDQGSSFEHTFTFTINNTALNLTAFDARMQIRKTYGSTSTIWNGTLANGKLVIVSAAAGTLKVVFSANDFTSTQFGSVDADILEGVFDLEIISPANKVYKPVAGSITINREVTR